MSREQAVTSSKIYYQVFNGTFRTRASEGEDGALERINKKGRQVFEREVKALFGLIEDVSFEDTEYGKQLRITLDANEDGQHPVISFGAESKDGRDILKKLPSVDLKREVRIMPYRFTDEGNKEQSGIAIHQQGSTEEFSIKVKNHFFDEKEKQFINGYPTIDWDNATESEQKIYKIKRDDFLISYAKQHILPKFGGKQSVDDQFEQGMDEVLNTSEEPGPIPF